MLAMILTTAAATMLPATELPQGFVPLQPIAGQDNPNSLCTPDRRWCVTPPEPEDPTIYVDRGTTGPAYWSPPEGDGFVYTLLPMIAPLRNGAALMAVEAGHQASYSGGGGTFRDLVLLHVAPAGGVTRVLTLPASASLMIRACFSEKDADRRANACHDEYRMQGSIAIKDDGKTMPDIQFSTMAQSYPRGVSRDADSLGLPPLRKSDLIWETDQRCTYDRNFHFDGSQNQYVPNTPLPDCGQYLQE